MNNILRNLFSGHWVHTALGRPDRTYVSECTKSIDHFLVEHPEAKEEQRTGRLLYWERKVDYTAQQKADQDKAPDDGYGFYYSAWGSHQHPAPGSSGGKGNNAGRS